ncbi:hypothetical protein U9M48_003792 [Paspalum notatum var. saurae]|uniref:Uncharacterized protein n=1 Tax=Paspalum notatum var. saurae TaxID=547442 RepID=A0AAQ3PM82_PASNO
MICYKGDAFSPSSIPLFYLSRVLSHTYSMPRLGSATTTTMDRTTSPRVMLFGSASPFHGVNSFRHRIPSCHKPSRYHWRLRTCIGGYEIKKTMATTPEPESDQLYSSIDKVEFQRVVTSRPGFFLEVIPFSATTSLNLCFLDCEERMYLTLSRMFSIVGSTNLSPSLTMRLKTCPAHRW